VRQSTKTVEPETETVLGATSETAPGLGKVVTMKGGVPANLASMFEADAGKGTSQAAEDNMVPLIYILQDQSPQVLKRNPAYIEGAETGCIWLRNAPSPIVKGEEGIDFQPCFFEKDVVEWRDRDSGGGFIARHPFGPGEDIEKLAARLGAEKRVDEKNPNRFDYILPNSGHELIETRYHVGHVIRSGHLLPFVIPLSSSGHSFSREWMFKQNAKRTELGNTMASFACVYRLTTRLRKNASGEWFVFTADDGMDVMDYTGDEQKAIQLLTAGRSLFEAFDSGIKQADTPLSQAAAGPNTAEAEKHI
jgi:hypothetical protein